MTAHVLHRSVRPVHDGPGHFAGDQDWCGGCWVEVEAWRHPPMRNLPHADDCPACAETKPS